jgi:hypothetical protein
VKIAVDSVSRERIEGARLRFACEDCAHFDPAADRCAHEYPTIEHKRAQLERGVLVFCKEFELA